PLARGKAAWEPGPASRANPSSREPSSQAPSRRPRGASERLFRIARAPPPPATFPFRVPLTGVVTDSGSRRSSCGWKARGVFTIGPVGSARSPRGPRQRSDATARTQHSQPAPGPRRDSSPEPAARRSGASGVWKTLRIALLLLVLVVVAA